MKTGVAGGCMAAVPTASKNAYMEFVRKADKVFREHGALAPAECWGADVPDGELTSFPMAVKCRPDETVVFSWVVWPSREVRDAAMETIWKDERWAEMGDMPFDGKRMIWGGFEVIHDSSDC